MIYTDILKISTWNGCLESRSVTYVTILGQIYSRFFFCKNGCFSELQKWS